MIGRRQIQTRTIEVTLGELVETAGLLGRVLAQPYRGTSTDFTYRLGLLRRALLEHIDQDSAYEVARADLIRRHATVTGERIEFADAEAQRAFAEGRRALLAQPVTVTVPVFALEEFDLVPPLSQVDAITLSWLTESEAAPAGVA